MFKKKHLVLFWNMPKDIISKKMIELDLFHLEDIHSKQHPSIFFRHERYDLFIFRVPVEKGKRIVARNMAFVIQDENYYYFDRTQKSFILLKDSEEFYRYIDQTIDEIMQLVALLTQRIENIEDIFYEGGKVGGFTKKWIHYKSSLIRLHRLLSKAQEAFEELIRTYKHKADYLNTPFEDLLEHLKRAYSNSENLLQKIDTLYDFYTTKNNEQINRTIYVLTILSAIFLPLNLLVGFFGMNTTSLPFSQSEGGTYSVLAILFVVALIATLLAYFIKNR